MDHFPRRGYAGSMNIPEKKATLRKLMLAARREMSPDDLKREDSAIISHAAALLRSLPPADTSVAAYSPLPGEPGGGMLLDALHGEAASLILPISLPDGTLDWAPYQGRLALNPGVLGIAEPTGQRQGPNALEHCRLILVPALGVNSEGIRIGKGGGYYDRALASLAQLHNPPRTAVLLYNSEIRNDIPTESHDMPVDLAITPMGIRNFS